MGKHAYFGTCLVGGRHEPGSDLEKECPELRKQRRAAKRASKIVKNITSEQEVEENERNTDKV